MYENYLEHHGIKGMRWGVRRRRPQQVTGTRRKAKTVGADKATKKRRKAFVKGVASAALVGGAVGRATGWNKEIRELGDLTNDSKTDINMRTINRRTAVGAALGAGTYAAAYAHAAAKRKKNRK